MIVLTLARKPLIGSVATNVLKHGTGGLNIDAARIGYASEQDRTWKHSGVIATGGFHKSYVGGEKKQDHPTSMPSLGRWPANLILCHLPGCRCAGVKDIRPQGGSGRASPKGHGFQDLYVGGSGHAAGVPGGFVDKDGFETVRSWECTPECPVFNLDQQGQAVGIHSAGNQTDRSPGSQLGISKGVTWHFGGQGQRHGDIGGASRFFKQAQAQEAQQP